MTQRNPKVSSAVRLLTKRSVFTAAFGATVLAAAACGSGSSSSGGTTASSAGGNATVSGAAADQVTDYPAYIGGKAGKADASLPAITIGWVNNQGGATPFEVATQAAQAAVDYINAELSGIGGHPLALSTCFIATAEEEGTGCGQKMVNNQAVSVIDYGAVVLGNQALQGAIGGQKPILTTIGSASDAASRNTYLLFGSQTTVLSPYGTYARDVLRAKSAAVVFAQQAGANTAAEATKKGLTDAGIQVKSVGYDPATTDLLAPLTAAGGQSADVIVSMTDIPGCANLAKALQQTGNTKPVISAPTCLSPQVASALGGDLPKWVYGLGQTLALDTSAADAQTFITTSGKYGLKKEALGNPYTGLAWSTILMTAKLMNRVGADKVSPQTMSDAIKSFTGPAVMGPPKIQCGKYPDQPGACGDQAKFYEYVGANQFKASTGYLSPP